MSQTNFHSSFHHLCMSQTNFHSWLRHWCMSQTMSNLQISYLISSFTLAFDRDLSKGFSLLFSHFSLFSFFLIVGANLYPTHPPNRFCSLVLSHCWSWFYCHCDHNCHCPVLGIFHPLPSLFSLNWCFFLIYAKDCIAEAFWCSGAIQQLWTNSSPHWSAIWQVMPSLPWVEDEQTKEFASTWRWWP